MSSNQPVLDLGGMPGAGSRPDWTQAGWWDAELRPEVRELLSLELGPAQAIKIGAQRSP